MASPPLSDQPDADSFNSGDEPFASASSNNEIDLCETWIWLSELSRHEAGGGANGAAGGYVLDPPRMVGKFRLDAIVGMGGYGVVFRAFDSELERFCALKLAWPHIMHGRVSAARFFAEAKAAASLTHPGIVRVFNADWIGPIYGIELELVEGPNLAEWLKGQEQVPFDLAATIVTEVADAAHYAHTKEIVHRDLKPSNILLRSDDSRSPFPFEPLVTDFGLAHRPQPPEASALTRTHDAIGTEPYIAPEHLDGSRARPAATSDVFSLGIILYELIAGRRPFLGESSVEIASAIRNDNPPPFRSFRAKVPKDLETIVLKCLEKSPADRYATAQLLADDLGRFLRNEPIKARRPAIVSRMLKYAQRKPAAVSFMMSTAFGVLVLVGIVGTWASDRIAARNQVVAAEAAAVIAEEIEQGHEYAANIQRAVEALRRGGRRDVLALLEKCRSTAPERARCGLEWHYLWAQANDAERTIEASDRSIHSVRFSPLGDVLLSAGEDGRVVLWDTRTWTKRTELHPGVGDVNVAEFSADGSLMAVAGDDGRLVVYRAVDGTTVFDEPITAGRVFAGTWIGKEQRFVIGGAGAVLSVVDPIDHTPVKKLSLPASAQSRLIDAVHPDEIGGLAYNQETEQIAVIKSPPELHLVDASSLTVAATWGGDQKGGSVICHIPVGPGYVATACGDPSIRIWNIHGTAVATIPMNEIVQELRYARGTDSLAAALRNGVVKTWNFSKLLETPHATGRQHSAHTGRANTLDYSPDNAWLASGGRDGRIRLWHNRPTNDSCDVVMKESPRLIKFSSCGRWLIVVSADQHGARRLTLFDAYSGKRLWSTDGLAVPEACFDATGDTVAFLDAEQHVRRCNSRTGMGTKTFTLPNAEPISEFAFSPDGECLIAKGEHGGIFLLNQGDGVVVDSLSEHEPWCLGQFRTSRGDLWLKANSAGQWALHSALNAPPEISLAGISARAPVAAVSPDGRTLAVGGADRIIYHWNLEEGSPATTFISPGGQIRELCFSADGNTLLSHSSDGTVRFLHIPTNVELLKLGSTEERIRTFGLHPSGSLLVFGIEHEGQYGLQLNRLGPSRDSITRTFDLDPPTK